MVVNYRFWHFLTNPSALTYALEQQDQQEKVKGYKTCFWLVFLATIVVFVVRNMWGMHTEGLTYLFVEGSDDLYSFARLLSLSGSVLWAICFFLFHYFVFTYVLHLVTDLPYKWLKKVQLYVIFFMLIEKLVLFIVFAIAGFTTPLSFFSLAPAAAYLTQDEFILFFLNQLSVATIVAIYLQYTFLSDWEEGSKKVLLTKLICLHVILALIVASISLLPIYEWIQRGLG